MVIPRVRVVVLNYNGGDLIERCLSSLSSLEWPREHLEIVVIDNGSTDGSPQRLGTTHPDVRLLTSEKNRGFAGGNNLALRDLAGIDYVALLNNDATVDPGWLDPLVRALEADDRAGAACPKILFASRFQTVRMSAPCTVPGRGDRRSLGLRVSGVRVDGVDRWREAQFVDGWWGLQPGDSHEPLLQWSGPEAVLRVPSGSKAELRLAADRAKTVQLNSGQEWATLDVCRQPAWYPVPLSGESCDVINNAGNLLVDGGYGADRGYFEPDGPGFDKPAEVFGWCGASVLLRRQYLEDVGLFDERLFLYYEDFDLSWRGRNRGWRYWYVPQSVVRHIHSATAVEGSRLYDYYVERNRLLVLAKNASWRLAAGAAGRYLLTTSSYVRRDILSRVLRRRTARLTIPRERLRAFAGYLRLLPAMLIQRIWLAIRRLKQEPDTVTSASWHRSARGEPGAGAAPGRVTARAEGSRPSSTRR